MSKKIPQSHGGAMNQYEPGESGNPKGRPRKIPSLDQLLEKIPENDYQAIINKLTEKAKKGNIRAAEVVLERAYGKSVQPLQVDNEITVVVRHES